MPNVPVSRLESPHSHPCLGHFPCRFLQCALHGLPLKTIWTLQLIPNTAFCVGCTHYGCATVCLGNAVNKPVHCIALHWIPINLSWHNLSYLCGVLCLSSNITRSNSVSMYKSLPWSNAHWWNPEVRLLVIVPALLNITPSPTKSWMALILHKALKTWLFTQTLNQGN